MLSRRLGCDAARCLDHFNWALATATEHCWSTGSEQRAYHIHMAPLGKHDAEVWRHHHRVQTAMPSSFVFPRALPSPLPVPPESSWRYWRSARSLRRGKGGRRRVPRRRARGLCRAQPWTPPSSQTIMVFQRKVYNDTYSRGTSKFHFF